MPEALTINAETIPSALELACCLSCGHRLEGRPSCASCGRAYPEVEGILHAIGPLTGTNRTAAQFYDGPHWQRFRPWEQLFLWFQGPGPRMNLGAIFLVVEFCEASVRSAVPVFVRRVHRSVASVEVDHAWIQPAVESPRVTQPRAERPGKQSHFAIVLRQCRGNVPSPPGPNPREERRGLRRVRSRIQVTHL